MQRRHHYLTQARKPEFARVRINEILAFWSSAAGLFAIASICLIVGLGINLFPGNAEDMHRALDAQISQSYRSEDTESLARDRNRLAWLFYSAAAVFFLAGIAWKNRTPETG